MIFDELDLQIPQFVVADFDIAVAVEFEAFDDLVAAQLFPVLESNKRCETRFPVFEFS